MILERLGRRRVWLILAVAAIGAGAVAASAAWTTRLESGSGSRLGDALAWRSRLAAIKATGGLPDLSIADVVRMMRQPGGFGLEAVVHGVSADGAIRNPYVTDADQRAAEPLFTQRCAGCHGADGGGTHGAPLNRSGLRHGDSDLALYKVVRDGIPGTAMPATTNLSFQERWQVAGFVRALQLRHSREPATERPSLDVHVDAEEITVGGSSPDAWTTYSGSIDGWRYTSLADITPNNVSQLKLHWVQQFENDDPIQASPIVVGGVIFTTVPPSNVVALDAHTGTLIWRHTRREPDNLPLCCRRVNRGLAIFGNVLFWQSLDGHLLAINANSGQVLWETQVADPADGFTMTGAPLVADRLVVVGVAGRRW
jgi:alcohol dehydrogenase (cytochrome c)